MKEKNSNGKSQSEIDASIKKMKKEEREAKIQGLDLDDGLRPYIEQARDTGASSWLNLLPIREQQLDLNKEQSSDALCMRYNFLLSGLKSFCECGSTFSVTLEKDSLHRGMTTTETNTETYSPIY